MAWRVPSLWKELQSGETTLLESSKVLVSQKQLLAATRKVLLEIAADIRAGLLETVGVESRFVEEQKCSIILDLPADANAETIARAIDAENIEAWCDAEGRVHVGISPWFTTKDVDQTVLCTIKVIHVLLGIHAGDADVTAPRTFGQKLLKAIIDVMLILKKSQQRKF
ncbi:MAG: hypothetical protein ABI954_15785 [Pyrinomonadaceae bacterium]